jgi:hypothetical protein
MGMDVVGWQSKNISFARELTAGSVLVRVSENMHEGVNMSHVNL